MKTSPVPPPKAQPLLDHLRFLRTRAGDCLQDEEFTFVLLRRNLPSDQGFTFLCFHDGCVTLAVPAQQDSAWQTPAGCLAPAKERMAAAIAQKHGLTLWEPPDEPPPPALTAGPAPYHHFRFADRKETIIAAHPGFLKIRLYSTTTKRALPLGADLLEDLAALYKAE